MSYTDYENKVSVDLDNVLDEGFWIFDYHSQSIEVFLNDSGGVRLHCPDPLETDLSKKEVGVLIEALKSLHSEMEE